MVIKNQGRERQRTKNNHFALSKPIPLTESLSIIRESGIYTGPQTGLIAVLINTGTLHQYNGKLNVNADCIDTIADTKIDKSMFINIH